MFSFAVSFWASFIGASVHWDKRSGEGGNQESEMPRRVVQQRVNKYCRLLLIFHGESQRDNAAP